MGGAAGSSSGIYFLGDSNNKFYYKTSLPLGSTVDPDDAGSLPSSLKTYDLAREGDDNSSSGNIWVATDDSDSPIRAYKLDDGTLTDGIDSNLVSSARGLAYSHANNHRYIWASNPSDKKIYKVDLDGSTGVAGEHRCQLLETSLTADVNPFGGSVIITGSGFSGTTGIEIFDTYGHRILEAPFSGSYSWNGHRGDGTQVPSGVYYVKVSDSTGRAASLSVVKL